MNEARLRKRLERFISDEELAECAKHVDKFSDLAWEITCRIVEEDSKKHDQVHLGVRDFIAMWLIYRDRFIAVRDVGAGQVDLAYRKHVRWEVARRDGTPFVDWGLFSNADDALKAYLDPRIFAEQVNRKDEYDVFGKGGAA